MIRRRARKSTLLLFLSIVLLVLSSAVWVWSDQGSNDYPIMRPDYETRMKWITSYENSPKIQSAKTVESTGFSPGGSLDLLSHLDYTPSERNQGSCGNCWAWAGTGVMEIALDVQEGIHERLSIQHINSCDDSRYACCGGWLENVADFYSEEGRAIPWSNTNASWQDGSNPCSSDWESAVDCEDISTSSMFPIKSIESQTIQTQGVGQAQAIANIKGILDQNRAVWFAFFMGTADDWSSFRTFWSSQTEDTLWDFDTTCGHTYTSDGGGHAVLCVGYNDDVAEPYWIMLNSWGSRTNRPNGLFRVAMDMDYDCTYRDGGSYYSIYWQTLDIDYGTLTTEAATSITSSSATLNGIINLGAGYTTYYFQYGTTTSYGTETESTNTGSGTGYIPVSADATGLAVYTTYHYRIVATGSGGAIYGNDETFTTLAVPPTAATGAVSSVGLNTATLEGTVNPHHASTTYYFEYGATNSYGSETTVRNAGSGTDNVTVEAGISGLSSCTDYHYRIVATNTAGTAEGTDRTFSTDCAEESGDGGGGGGCFITTP